MCSLKSAPDFLYLTVKIKKLSSYLSKSRSTRRTALQLCLALLDALASLENSNLSGADLSNVQFTEIYLEGANLCQANLSHACLHSNVYLRGANLSNANLRGANLTGVCDRIVKITGHFHPTTNGESLFAGQNLPS